MKKEENLEGILEHIRERCIEELRVETRPRSQERRKRRGIQRSRKSQGSNEVGQS